LARFAAVVIEPGATLLTVKLSLPTHPKKADHAGVGQHVRYRNRDCRLRIEETADGREFAIEQIVDEAIDLEILGELIRAVQVRDPVVGELRVLVGVIANKPLATDPDDVGTEQLILPKVVVPL
jgi:hypothetical protein